MGRPRKLINASVKNYTEEERIQKQKEEEKLMNFEKLDFSYYPAGLLQQAYHEWERISHFIGDLPISELDQQAMVRYCNYSYLYSEMAEQVAYEGPLTEDGKLNPKVTAMNSYSKELKSATNDLGLTINSRLKLVAPKEVEDESKDPLGQLLKMRSQG